MSTSILAFLGAMKLERMQGDGSLWLQDRNINPQVSVEYSGAKAEGGSSLQAPYSIVTSLQGTGELEDYHVQSHVIRWGLLVS